MSIGIKERAALSLGAILVGASLLGGAAFAALPPQATELSGHRTSSEREESVADRPKPPKLADLLQKLVDEGKITAAQRELILEKIKEATERRDDRKREHRFKVTLTEVHQNAAAYIGVDEKSLSEELRAGKSLAEIALARGKTRDGLIAAISAPSLARIEDALKSGKITEEQAKKAKAELAERAAEVVDAKRAAKPERKDRGNDKVRIDHEVHAFIGNVVQAAERYLGIDMGDLQKALHTGKSLGEIANATPGKSRDGLVLAIATAANAKIDEAKAAGKLTAEQAAALKAKVAEAVAKAVDAKLKAIAPGQVLQLERPKEHTRPVEPRSMTSGTPGGSSLRWDPPFASRGATGR